MFIILLVLIYYFISVSSHIYDCLFTMSILVSTHIYDYVSTTVYFQIPGNSHLFFSFSFASFFNRLIVNYLKSQPHFLINLIYERKSLYLFTLGLRKVGTHVIPLLSMYLNSISYVNPTYVHSHTILIPFAGMFIFDILLVSFSHNLEYGQVLQSTTKASKFLT